MELTLDGWIIGYLLNEGPAPAGQIAESYGNPDVTTRLVEDTLWGLYGTVYQVGDVWHVS